MPPPQGGMGWRGQPYAVNGPQPTMQFQTEIMLLQGDERIRNHREALKSRLHVSGLNLEELEYAVRMMVMRGQFANSAGIPETMLMPALPERFLSPGSPFRTIAELASSIPWLLRVHQSMQWVQQMPNGLMTVQRLICPAASEMGGLAAPDGVLAVDWAKVDEVMARLGGGAAAGRGLPPLDGGRSAVSECRALLPAGHRRAARDDHRPRRRAHQQRGRSDAADRRDDAEPPAGEGWRRRPATKTQKRPRRRWRSAAGRRQARRPRRRRRWQRQQQGGWPRRRCHLLGDGEAGDLEIEAAAAGGEAAKASAPPAAPTTTESKTRRRSYYRVGVGGHSGDALSHDGTWRRWQVVMVFEQ